MVASEALPKFRARSPLEDLITVKLFPCVTLLLVLSASESRLPVISRPLLKPRLAKTVTYATVQSVGLSPFSQSPQPLPPPPPKLSAFTKSKHPTAVISPKKLFPPDSNPASNIISSDRISEGDNSEGSESDFP
ncbi:hypothetical protein BaRGS_00000327 [Batillaria attramentaria]|uniref:Uncharacterized protein n=1 Tax=Batillaria attramentaria TaxID=370345 RepID=A0ABD0M8F1_9CAEN